MVYHICLHRKLGVRAHRQSRVQHGLGVPRYPPQEGGGLCMPEGHQEQQRLSRPEPRRDKAAPKDQVQGESGKGGRNKEKQKKAYRPNISCV